MDLNNLFLRQGRANDLRVEFEPIGVEHATEWVAKIYSTQHICFSKQSLIFIVVNEFYASGRASTKKGAQEIAAEATLAQLEAE
jgi:hypothetical protein